MSSGITTNWYLLFPISRLECGMYGTQNGKDRVCGHSAYRSGHVLLTQVGTLRELPQLRSVFKSGVDLDKTAFPTGPTTGRCGRKSVEKMVLCRRIFRLD